MIIYGIDAGPETSGVCVWDTERKEIIRHSEAVRNDYISPLFYVDEERLRIDMFVIEDIEYRKSVNVGKTVFDTCKTIGRLQERLGEGSYIMYRKSAVSNHFFKLKLLKERYPAGTKKKPGITYGLKHHAWDAFALCIFHQDKEGL